MDRRLLDSPPSAKIGTVIVMLRAGGDDRDHGSRCEFGRCRAACASAMSTQSGACKDFSRTRLDSQSHSDCDSVVNRWRPRRNKSKNLWRRYDNVFAAVCLLLLIGGLSPQSAAAPLPSKKMDSTSQNAKRYADNPLWDNPCDYKNINDIPVLEYTPERAKDIAILARNVRDKTAAYSNDFASKIHSYDKFEVLLDDWVKEEWLRGFSWFRDEILPKKKVFNKPLNDDYVISLVNNIDDVLPTLHKSLKVIVAGLDVMQREGLNDLPSPTLKDNVFQTMNDVRAVLCQFNDLMKSRNLETLKIESQDIPRFDGSNGIKKEVELLIVYRDTLNILEYVAQLFQKMSDNKE